MFFSVILAYVLAAVFAFCGVMGTVNYVMEAQRDMGYFAFLAGLVVTLWPLAVALVLVLLTQIACKIERWMLLWTMAQTPAAKPVAPGRSASPPAAAPKAPPAPAAPTADRIATVTPPVIQDTPTEPSAPAAVPSPAPAATPSPAPARPAAPAQDGLNFFKLD